MIVSPPLVLSPHEFLCNMHLNNPRSPTTFCEGPGQGPWFSITSSLDMNIDGVESKGHEGTTIKSEVASNVMEHEVGTHEIVNMCPTTRDTSMDEAKTIDKLDGR
jgi:hypothetical protein